MEEILFQEICVSWKQMFGIDKKATFSIWTQWPIQSMISRCYENSEHPWWSRFSIEFSWQDDFSWSIAF